jgi:LysR family transcriptional regulator, glycine cleavage system transcriptional activator
MSLPLTYGSVSKRQLTIGSAGDLVRGRSNAASRPRAGLTTASLPPLASLQTIEVLSRHRRIGAAANELGLSHAAVSQAITRLEKRLGARLFVRTSLGAEPTAICRTLVEAYLSASSTLSRALGSASETERYQVLAPFPVWSWLSPTIARLHQACPNFSFRGYRFDEAPDLESIDFAVVPLGVHPPTGFDGAPLYDERLIPVCAPDYAASVRLDTPSALARARLLIARKDQWLAWFADAGLVNEPRLEGPEMADPSLAMQAAVRGQGVALCCTVAAAAAIARGELTTPIGLSTSAGRRMWAIWRKTSDQTPAMRVLDGLLSELHAFEGAIEVELRLQPYELGARNLA